MMTNIDDKHLKEVTKVSENIVDKHLNIDVKQ